MAQKTNHQESTTEELFKGLEEGASKSEKFVENNKNIIIGAVAAIILVIGGVMSYNNYYIAPKEKEATNELFKAKKYFEQESYKVALEGDGQYLGFLDISDDYGMTKSGNMANYYAGLSYLKLGQFDNAVKFLDNFSSDDKMVGPVAKGAIGDAFIGLNQLEDALSYYKQAATLNNNDFTSPLYLFKAGQVALKIKDFATATDMFETIKKDYPNSQQAQSIDKFIARAQASK
ncbi:MAG: tetratricopeptide repeat protein [Ichthyobacteriaceae bacterium]|nr:tetratricopeptide repeat protein [Ichthyobacteriaceae bacterium]